MDVTKTFCGEEYKDTVSENQCYTPRLLVFCFVLLDDLPVGKSATNDMSFESPNTELSEFIKKLDVASSWRWPRPIY